MSTVEVPFNTGDVVKYDASGFVATVMNVLPGAIILNHDNQGNPFMTRVEPGADGWGVTRIR